MVNPLKQFDVVSLFNFQGVHFTNSSLFMLLVLMLVGLFYIGLKRSKRPFFVKSHEISALKSNKDVLIPGRIRAMGEIFYSGILEIVKNTAGPSAAIFVPFAFTLFLFIVLCNLVSLVPGAFAVTSNIMVTFALAFFIFISITVIGFIKHRSHYLTIFLPAGTPAFLAPLIFIIELFVYIARPISLSLRLTANMIAGHIVLEVIASLAAMAGVFLAILPLSLLTVLTGFEVFIAILQAYIFTMLSCVYLSDALNLH